MPIKILQCNAQHKKATNLILSNEMKKKTYDVIIVQEPYIPPRMKTIPNVPDSYDEISAKTGNQRAAILIKKALKFLPSTKNTDEIATLTLKTRTLADVTIISCYNPNDDRTKPLDYIRRNDLTTTTTLIGIDSNSHSTLLNYDRSDECATEWEEFMMTNGLTMANDPDKTTFKNNNGQSRIDWTLTTNNLTDKLTNWRTDEIDILSDHIPITFDLTLTPTKKPKKKQRHWKAANWDKINKDITELTTMTSEKQLPYDEDSLNAFNDEITDNLTKIIDENVPMKTIPERNPEWWTDELDKLKRDYKKTKRNRHKTTDDILEAKRKYEKGIFKAKEQAWRNFVSSTKTNGELFMLNKILTKQRKKREIKMIHDEAKGRLTIDEDERNRLLMDSLDGDLNLTTDRQRQIEMDAEQIETRQHDFDKITPDEIANVIRHLNPSKAPGPDNIPPTFYRRCLTTMTPLLTILFNAIMTLTTLPKAHKTGRVIFIEKPDKEGTKIKDYRPITLLNVSTKIFEKIIYRRLQPIAALNSWTSTHQYGYQQHISAEDALCYLTNKIQTDFKNGAENLTIFFDVSGAFNDAWHAKITKTLDEKNCPTVYLKLLTNFLSDRRIHHYDDEKIQRKLKKGIPQGSVLSPLLWNTFYDEIASIVTKTHAPATPILFADDLAVTLTIDDVKDRKKAQKTMNEIIDEIMTWSEDNLLNFNPTKTSTILFSRRKRPIKIPRHDIKLTMKDEILTPTNKTKYLGVTLDKRLNFNDHVTIVTKKAKKKLFALKSAIGHNWGLRPNQIKDIYKLVTVPTMTYGAGAWANAAKHWGNKQKMTSVQRIAALKITGCLSTTATETLQILSGLPPIDLTTDERATRTTLRQLTTPTIDSRLKLRPTYLTTRHIKRHPSSLQRTLKTIDDLDIDEKLDHDEYRRQGKKKLRLKKMREWTTRWENGTKGRLTYDILKGTDRTKFSTDKLTNRILSGHYYNFPMYRRRFNLDNSDKCDLCDEEQADIKHLLQKCDNLDYLRTKYDLHDADMTKILTNKKFLQNLTKN